MLIRCLLYTSADRHLRKSAIPGRAYRQAHRNRRNRSSEPCKNHQPDWQKTVCGKSWKLHSVDSVSYTHLWEALLLQENT